VLLLEIDAQGAAQVDHASDHFALKFASESSAERRGALVPLIRMATSQRDQRAPRVAEVSENGVSEQPGAR
jgi:hypothetical protein